MFDLFFLWRKNLIMCLFLYKRVNISKICSYCHSKRMAVCYHLCGVVSSNLLQAFVPFGLMRLVWMLLVKTQIKDQNSFFYCIDTAGAQWFLFFLSWPKGFLLKHYRTSMKSSHIYWTNLTTYSNKMQGSLRYGWSRMIASS